MQRLLRMLAQRAQLDGLTGLWNRAYLDDRLAAEVASSVRYEKPLSLILCDLDRFKSLNDAHGHPFGDEVLERAAAVLAGGSSAQPDADKLFLEHQLAPISYSSDGSAASIAERCAASSGTWPPAHWRTSSCSSARRSR